MKNNNNQTTDITLNIEQIDDSTDKVIDKNSPPYIQGEASMSGSAADVESDDDMLEASQEVGLRQDESDEHPKPLNIAEDIKKSETARRRPPIKKNQ